jgi:hypothetical protein
MLTVACVLRPSKDFDVEYVARLKAGVEANLRGPHRFVCLSSVAVPCERIRLEHDWPGWWSKIELFRLPPPVLCFDLDTMIVGDLGGIEGCAKATPFIALRDFYREKGLGSGMMSWCIGMSGLYDAFAANPHHFMDRHRRGGDQLYIEESVRSVRLWQDMLPGQVVSYKAHVQKGTKYRQTGDGTIPANARVVCFHGSPRPRDIAWTI